MLFLLPCQFSTTSSGLNYFCISDPVKNVNFLNITDAFSHFKPCKAGCSGLHNNHFVLASPVLNESLAEFFTTKRWHGYLPSHLKVYTLVPIVKRNNDPFSSNSDSANALVHILSQLLEWSTYFSSSIFLISDSNLVFKQHISAVLAHSRVKSPGKLLNTLVFASFLVASKALIWSCMILFEGPYNY